MKNNLLRLTLFCLLGLGLFSCKKADKSIKYDDMTVHGKDFEAQEVLSVDELMARLEDRLQVENIVVRGEVSGVCQKKGCWMTLKAPEGKEDIFVKFEDYGFFMPLDLTGEITMKGKAYIDVTSVDDQRHYAEDAGKSEEEIMAITSPKKELKFLATGVQIPN